MLKKNWYDSTMQKTQTEDDPWNQKSFTHAHGEYIPELEPESPCLQKLMHNQLCRHEIPQYV